MQSVHFCRPKYIFLTWVIFSRPKYWPKPTRNKDSWFYTIIETLEIIFSVVHFLVLFETWFVSVIIGFQIIFKGFAKVCETTCYYKNPSSWLQVIIIYKNEIKTHLCKIKTNRLLKKRKEAIAWQFAPIFQLSILNIIKRLFIKIDR